MLPRVYVGPPAGRATLAGAVVPLSPVQAHHLINVMRIFKKRRKSRRIRWTGATT